MKPGNPTSYRIFQTHHTHTVVIITHYKRMGYVIIHKPNCSGHECTNSRCRRFDLLLFRRFGSICRRYDRSYRRSGCRCSVCRWRPTVMHLPPFFVAGRWSIEINTRAGDTVSARFLRIKQLLGRTETRTRERKCCQSIQTV